MADFTKPLTLIKPTKSGDRITFEDYVGNLSQVEDYLNAYIKDGIQYDSDGVIGKLPWENFAISMTNDEIASVINPDDNQDPVIIEAITKAAVASLIKDSLVGIQNAVASIKVKGRALAIEVHNEPFWDNLQGQLDSQASDIIREKLQELFITPDDLAIVDLYPTYGQGTTNFLPYESYVYNPNSIDTNREWFRVSRNFEAGVQINAHINTIVGQKQNATFTLDRGWIGENPDPNMVIDTYLNDVATVVRTLLTAQSNFALKSDITSLDTSSLQKKVIQKQPANLIANDVEGALAELATRADQSRDAAFYNESKIDENSQMIFIYRTDTAENAKDIHALREKTDLTNNLVSLINNEADLNKTDIARITPKVDANTAAIAKQDTAITAVTNDLHDYRTSNDLVASLNAARVGKVEADLKTTSGLVTTNKTTTDSAITALQTSVSAITSQNPTTGQNYISSLLTYASDAGTPPLEKSAVHAKWDATKLLNDNSGKNPVFQFKKQSLFANKIRFQYTGQTVKRNLIFDLNVGDAEPTQLEIRSDASGKPVILIGTLSETTGILELNIINADGTPATDSFIDLNTATLNEMQETIFVPLGAVATAKDIIDANTKIAANTTAIALKADASELTKTNADVASNTTAINLKYDTSKADLLRATMGAHYTEFTSFKTDTLVQGVSSKNSIKNMDGTTPATTLVSADLIGDRSKLTSTTHTPANPTVVDMVNGVLQDARSAAEDIPQDIKFKKSDMTMTTADDLDGTSEDKTGATTGFVLLGASAIISQIGTLEQLPTVAKDNLVSSIKEVSGYTDIDDAGILALEGITI